MYVVSESMIREFQSRSDQSSHLMLAIMTVLQLPPSESFNSRVSLLLRYGTCTNLPCNQQQKRTSNRADTQDICRAVILVFWLLSNRQYTLLSARALIQFPRASNDLLMLAPSRNLMPRLVVTVARSEPARSISDILAQVT